MPFVSWSYGLRSRFSLLCGCLRICCEGKNGQGSGVMVVSSSDFAKSHFVIF